jgi:hypothetical protein
MKKDKADDGARPFTQFLQEQRKGGLHLDLTDGLAEVVRAVMEHGKQGTLAVSLKIKPIGDGQVQIIDAVKVGAPEGEKAASIFYTDEQGNVSRKNPHQQEELPLKQVGEAVAASA